MADKASAAGGKLGNVKLIGIAGVVKGAKFSVRLGETAVIGRSRECDISLRELPAVKELAERGEDHERHFHTVSRKHVSITYHEFGNVEVEDLSSNGCFLDGKKIEGSIEINDLEKRPHELRLGTTVVFQLDWWRLVPLSSIKMPKVKVKKSEELVEEDPESENDSEELDPNDPTSHANDISQVSASASSSGTGTRPVVVEDEEPDKGISDIVNDQDGEDD